MTMHSHVQRIEKILAASNLPAAGRLLKKEAPQLEDHEIEQLEDLVLGAESGPARLDRLIDALHENIGEAYEDLRGKLARRVVYRPPRYENVLAAGFAEPEQICRAARRWVHAIHAEATREPARLLGELVVGLILDFQVLDEDAIPALVKSLGKNRRIVLKQWIGAVPIEIVNTSGTDRVERLLVLKGSSADHLRTLLEDLDASKYLAKLAADLVDTPRAAVKAIEALEVLSGKEKIMVRIKPLIEAARQMAILKLRTSVVGVRTGLVRSHALNLATMQRITQCSPRVLPFAAAKSEEVKDPVPEVEVDEEEFRAWPWMQELRTLVKADSYDKPGLQRLKENGDFCGKTLAGYALFLTGRKAYEESTVHKYVFLVANRLMLKVAGKDEASAEEAWEKLQADQIAWEDLIEQVLDDDAYYHRRRFSGRTGAVANSSSQVRAAADKVEERTADDGTRDQAAEAVSGAGTEANANEAGSSPADPDRDAAGYSRALLKALGSFVEYLNRGKQASEELTTKLPPAGMIAVDATMITVDEFRKALDWFEGPNVNQSQVHLRKAARVALILAFRCGLRRAEIAYLRVRDFDRLGIEEKIETADLRLRVRPWLLRQLKTANAVRDLPLRVLMPVEELREVLSWVEGVRAKGGDDGLVFHASRAKKESDYAEPMSFDSVVEALTDAFTKNVTKRKGKGRPPVVPGWHMHQCRHAFANVTLLRLWPELHDFARQMFRYHPETLAWIAGEKADPEQTRSDQSGPDQLRRDLFRAGIRGSDLQAIALLMGHGASATTAEHYLHVLDWHTPAEVGQLNVSRPQNEESVARRLAYLFTQRPAPAAEGPPAS
jgi:integrase